MSMHKQKKSNKASKKKIDLVNARVKALIRKIRGAVYCNLASIFRSIYNQKIPMVGQAEQAKAFNSSYKGLNGL